MAETFVPLSVRYVRWWLQGRREALALRLAPWLAGPPTPDPDPNDLLTRITAALQRAGAEPLVANAGRPLDELVAELTDKQRAEGAHQERVRLTSDGARAVVVDFFDAWRFCPVSRSDDAPRRCLEDTAAQLLDALRAELAPEGSAHG